jgi:Kef-type K+ transport system membrane component KefB
VVWLVLGVVLTTSGGAGDSVRSVAMVVLFLVFLGCCVRPALTVFLRVLGPRLDRLAAVLLLVAAVATASLSNIVGVHPVIGAFAFGAILPRGVAQLDRLTEQLRGFTDLVLLPVFFAGIGLRCSIGLINADWHLWALFGLILVLAVAAKFLGTQAGVAMAGPASHDFTRHDRVALCALMNCRGVTELILAMIGLQQHLVNDLGYTMLVLIAVITMLMTGPVVRATAEAGNRQRLSAWRPVAESPAPVDGRS